MNVKNLDQFLKDIDKEKVVDWNMNQDCHRKIKKITLHKRTVLREEEYAEEIQITLENNPHHYERFSRGELNPEQQWEVPNRSIASIRKDKDMMDSPAFLPEKAKKDISKLLDEPLYDGRNYFKDGEVYRA